MDEIFWLVIVPVKYPSGVSYETPFRTTGRINRVAEEMPCNVCTRNFKYVT